MTWPGEVLIVGGPTDVCKTLLTGGKGSSYVEDDVSGGAGFDLSDAKRVLVGAGTRALFHPHRRPPIQRHPWN